LYANFLVPESMKNMMWTTESLWFEIAVVSIIYALGNILMGHFEERTPKIRRVGKYLLTLVVVCCISIYFGRTTSMAFLSLFIIPLLYVHGYYLPKKKGINGWTGEPKSKYYEFRKWDKDIFAREKNDKKA
jgi:sugar phosphate permease